MTFIHHPDGKIIIGEVLLDLNVFKLWEPAYSGLPEGYIGRVFRQGVKHFLINAENVQEAVPFDLNNAEFSAYEDRESVYGAALIANLQGAYVFNDGENLITQGPPQLAIGGSVIVGDAAIITATVADNKYGADAIWTVTTASGSSQQISGSFTDGIAELELITLEFGDHVVRIQTQDYGTAVIAFKAGV